MAIYLGNTPIKPIGISKVFVGPHQVYQSGPAHTDYLYFTSPSTGYIAYETFGTVNVNIQTSTDMTTWEAWDGTQKTISNNAKLYVKNTTNNLCVDTDNYVRFTTASGITLMGGNIMSMINYSDLTNYCFFGLFSDCTYLNTLDDFIMPATTLAEACYQSMFYGCSALTSTPVLPATTLVNNCYYYMFYNCSSLTVNQNTGEGVALLTCPDTTGVTTPVENMFSGTYGSFTKTPTTGNVYYRPECYLYFTSSNSATLGYTKSGSVSCNIQTSSDKTNWTDWNGSAITLSENKLYVRNTTNTLSTDFSNNFKFTTPSGAVKAGGNCMSMVNHAALSNDCFLYLFKGCTKLDLLSDFILSNRTLKAWCYREMFANCTSLTTAPKLPATTIPTYAYYRMFYQCTSLRTPPIIAATNVNAYYACCQMFSGCSNLLVNQGSGGVSFFKCPSALPEGAVTAMFANTGGSFVGTPTAGNTYYYVEPYLYFTTSSSGTVSYSLSGAVSCNIQTSTDKITWTNWSARNSKTLSSSKLYVRNTTNTLSSSMANNLKFAGTGSITAGGNVMSMINYAALSNYCFYGLFFDCSALTNVSALGLPSKTLKSNCYRSMFAQTKITTAPKLPATTLADSCYLSMFSGCTELTSIPSLPAKTLATSCYREMFTGCSGLCTLPTLSFTTLAANCCYRMFAYCYGLNISQGSGDTAFFTCPDTSGVSSPFYQMFTSTIGTFTEDPTSGNTYYYNEPLYFTTTSSGTIKYTNTGSVSCNLQTSTDKITWTNWSAGIAITLSSSKLYVRNTKLNFSSGTSRYVQFNNTGSVLVGGSTGILRRDGSVGSYGLYSLFDGCVGLDIANDFILPYKTVYERSYSAMFYNCTSLTKAPSLPATTLAQGCYGSMFSGCSSLDLTSNFSLPAKTLAASCYSNMFKNCTSLKTAPQIAATTLAATSCYYMFSGCSNLNVSENSGGTAFFTCPDMTGVTSPVVMMFDGTGGSFTEDPTSGNTYYYNQPATLTNNESLKNYIQSNNITSCSICKHSEVPEGTTDVTSAITGLSNGYAGVLNSALYISGLDDSMVIAAPDMSSLFGSANLLTSLSVSNLDTRNVTNMEGMFVSLPYVTTLDVSNFNTSNVTNMSSMFNMDVRLQTIIGLENFDTSKVIYFSMMFKGCAALTTLDLTSFSSDNCQYIFSMFEECTTLANIYVEESWYPTHTGSVQSGSGNDVFKNCPALPGYSATATNSYAYCRLSTETENPGYFTKKPEPLYFTTNSTGTVGYTKNGTVTCNLQTSSDKINWTDWDGTAITLSSSKLYVRNTLDTFSTSDSNYVNFTTTGSVLVGGTAGSLRTSTSIPNYGLTRLFFNCSGLDLANDFSLPYKTLSNYCYQYTFYGCSSLTTPPTLPATTLAQGCYEAMFQYCTSLIESPTLPATTLAQYCYSEMFRGCKVLNIPTNFTLPAQTLIKSCYQRMFQGCIGLSYAPQISATTLADSACYYMFSGCSNLKVSEGSGGTAFFTCPDTTGISYAVDSMFAGTGGSYTSDPTSGNIYYYN